MRASILSLALALPLVAGCSLLGFDRFDYPGCPQSECERFNARDAIDSTTACVFWQCVEATGECALRERDADGDTRPPLSCGGDDCDDTVATTNGMAAESCNGVDDDCNGWIDDVSAAPEMLEPLLAAGEPDWVSYTSTPTGLAAAYDSGDGAAMETFTGDPITTASDPLVLAATNEPYTLDTSMIAPGCPRTVATGHPQALCVGPTETCSAGQFCWTSRGGARLCDSRLLASPPPSTCNSDAECDDGVFCNGTEECLPGNPAADTFGCVAMVERACEEWEGCREASRECLVVDGPLASCDPVDVAVAPVADEWLSATVTTEPCPTGVLRLGYFTDTAHGDLVRYPLRQLTSRGDERGSRSSSWLGVDLAAGANVCPGVDRGAGQPLGASSPVIATLPADDTAGRLRPQGLVAYLAAPACRGDDSCSGSTTPGSTGPVAVELVGAWLEVGTAGGDDVAWVEGSAVLRPGAIASDTTRRPAIVSWHVGTNAGYVVAFGQSGGGLGVQRLPSLGDPAPVCGTPMTAPCLIATPPHVSYVSMSVRRVAPTLPAVAEDELGEATDQIVGDVAVAVGFTTATRVELLFAFATATEVALQRATIDPTTGALTAGTIDRFPSTGARELSVTHVDAGLVRMGATIDGTPVDDTMLGGFVAMWRDDDGVRAVRIADFDSSVVGDAAARVSSTAAWPRAFRDGGGALRGLVHQAGSWNLLPSICGN